MSISNRRLEFVKLIGLWLLLIVSSSLVMVNNNAFSLPISPQQQPIPELDFDDPAKSIVVLLTFEKEGPSPTDIEQATLMSVSISSERARTHIGDPPLLRVVLRDKFNAFADDFTTWSPLWLFFHDQNGKEHVKIQQKANGTIVFPFDRTLAWMDLFSMPTGKFITRVNLNATIQTFCAENPSDPNCKAPPVNTFCKDNPKDPDCKPSTRIAFCKENLYDPRCKRFTSTNLTNITPTALTNLTNNSSTNLTNLTGQNP